MHSYTRHLGDYAKDTRHLTLLEHGAYNVLMDWCYASERALPPDEAMLFRICAAFTKPEQQAVMSVIEQFFQQTPDGWIQKRIEEELMKAHDKRGKAKEAAIQRWNANAMRTHSEGNADAMRTHSEGNADAMRTHSEGNADAMPRVRALRNPVSLSSSIPPTPRQRGKSGKLTEPVFSDEVPKAYREPLTRWFCYKRELRKSYTPTGWEALVKQQLAYPAEIVAQSVDASMASSWQGLFTDKLTNSPASKPSFSEKKEGRAGEFSLVPEDSGLSGPPDGWEEAMSALWGEDWRDVYAAWEMMPPSDHAQVRRWLAAKKRKGGE